MNSQGLTRIRVFEDHVQTTMRTAVQRPKKPKAFLLNSHKHAYFRERILNTKNSNTATRTTFVVKNSPSCIL